jgi:hypothetical protein
MKSFYSITTLATVGLLTFASGVYAGDTSSLAPDSEQVIADLKPKVEQEEPESELPGLEEIISIAPTEKEPEQSPRYAADETLPQSDIVLPFYSYGDEELVIHQNLDKLVVDFLPHQGTQSAILFDKYTKQSIPNEFGRYVAEPRLEADVAYAASNLDGDDRGRDEVNVIGQDYMRFILDMDNLGEFLGDGEHELVVIEYTTQDAYRGVQHRSENGVMQPAQFENAIDDRFRFWITYESGELEEVRY